MIQIKRLAECTLEEGVKAWNVGFEGYFFDATTTVENFLNRLVLEGLSPRLSIVAFMDGEPVGIIKNGIRTFQGQKIAWNGGTGVATAYRKHGVGKALMDATLEIYQEEGVQIATLEAISENSRAISLYEKMGFEMIDDLEYLQLKGSLDKSPIATVKNEYTLEKSIPQLVGELDFYKGLNPWQTQWQSAKESEAIIIKDQEGIAIGYAYYRKVFNGNGIHDRTILYQCEADPAREDGKEIVLLMLGHIFGDFGDSVTRIIPNLPMTRSQLTASILKEIGFETTVKQVYMTKNM
ncbi:GNAT family N-acetyltransferase [Pseudoneobacillus sp. C159]